MAVLQLVIHLPVDGYLHWFQILIVINKAAIIIHGFIKHLVYAKCSIGKLCEFSP